MQSVLTIKVERLMLIGGINEHFEVESIDGSQVLLKWKDSDESVYVICELKPWDDILGKPYFRKDDEVSIGALLEFVRFYNSEHESLLETNMKLQESIEKLKSDKCIASCVGKCNVSVEFA